MPDHWYAGEAVSFIAQSFRSVRQLSVALRDITGVNVLTTLGDASLLWVLTELVRPLNAADALLILKTVSFLWNEKSGVALTNICIMIIYVD